MASFDEEKQNKELEDLRKKEEEELVEMLASTKYSLPYIDLAHFRIQQVRVLFLETFRNISRSRFMALCVPFPTRQEYESWMNLESKYR